MHRYGIYFSIFAAIALATPAISFEEEAPNARMSNNIEIVRVGYLPMVSSLTYFVATDKHYFIDERLDIRANPTKTSDVLAQDLNANNLDVAIELAIVPLLQSLREGDTPRFRIFSVSKIDAHNGFDGVLVNSKSNVTNLRDLSEKKVAVFPGTTALESFAAVFRGLYGRLSPPQFDNSIRTGDQLNALFRGDVDAVHAYEPILTIGKKRFGFRQIYGSIYAAQLSPNPIGVGALNASFIRTHRDAAVRFLRAIDRAVDYVSRHPEESRDILAKYTHADSDVAKEMSIMPMSASYQIDLANLDRYISILREIRQHRTNITAREICVDKTLSSEAAESAR